MDGTGSFNSLCENDSDVDENQTTSTSTTSSFSSSTTSLKRENKTINKASSKNSKRMLQSHDDNVPHVMSKKKCKCNNMLLELQMDKIKQNIEQQKELHEERMKAAAAETKLAILRMLAAEQEINDKNDI